MMPLRLNSIGGSKTLERNAIEIGSEIVLPGAQPCVGIGRGLVAQRDPSKRLGKGDLVAGNRVPRLRQNHGALVATSVPPSGVSFRVTVPDTDARLMLRSRMPFPRPTVTMLAIKLVVLIWGSWPGMLSGPAPRCSAPPVACSSEGAPQGKYPPSLNAAAAASPRKQTRR